MMGLPDWTAEDLAQIHAQRDATDWHGVPCPTCGQACETRVTGLHEVAIYADERYARREYRARLHSVASEIVHVSLAMKSAEREGRYVQSSLHYFRLLDLVYGSDGRSPLAPVVPIESLAPGA